jgi:hypothetical protein
MASYPNSIYDPREKEQRSGVVYIPEKKSVIFVEDVKFLDDEVVAIETELGLNPKGSFDDVASRLDALELRGGAFATEFFNLFSGSYSTNQVFPLLLGNLASGVDYGFVPSRAGIINGISFNGSIPIFSDFLNYTITVAINGVDTGLQLIILDNTAKTAFISSSGVSPEFSAGDVISINIILNTDLVWPFGLTEELHHFLEIIYT